MNRNEINNTKNVLSVGAKAASEDEGADGQAARKSFKVSNFSMADDAE
jgi:hypothetical protein